MRLDTKSKLDELQRKEEDNHRTTWTKRKECIEKWFDLDHKNGSIIDDITQEDQEDQDLEPNEKMSKEDEDDPSS